MFRFCPSEVESLSTALQTSLTYWMKTEADTYIDILLYTRTSRLVIYQDNNRLKKNPVRTGPFVKITLYSMDPYGI